MDFLKFLELGDAATIDEVLVGKLQQVMDDLVKATIQTGKDIIESRTEGEALNAHAILSKCDSELDRDELKNFRRNPKCVELFKSRKAVDNRRTLQNCTTDFDLNDPLTQGGQDLDTLKVMSTIIGTNSATQSLTKRLDQRKIWQPLT